MKPQAFNYYMHDGPTAFSIELAGALTAEDAKKLEHDWLNASAVIGKKELVVDLSFVTEIDPAGRQLLLRWRRNGATILANTPESRALAESVIGRLRRLARIAYTSQPYRPFFRDVLPIILLLALLIPGIASAQPLLMVQPTTPPESLAFARYLAWLNARDPFTESGPVALAIAASLPGLDKQGSLLAIREVGGESERNQYGIVGIEGDSIVFERAIAPYLAEQRAAEDLPRSSAIISPQNYNFCYAGTAETGDRTAYIFRITPKQNRAGLIRGEIWIEPLTGAPVLVTGQLVKTASSSIRLINVASEIILVDGHPFARTTHTTVETRPVGRAELTIIELPLRLSDQDAIPPSVSGIGRRSVSSLYPPSAPKVREAFLASMHL
jgi:hypothetical protein